MRVHKSPIARLADVATYVAAVPIAAFFLIPLVWLGSLAVRTPQEIFLGASRFIPENPTLDNFTRVLTDSGFLVYLGNALKLSALGGAGAVLVAAPAAYAFSRLRFRGRGTLMTAILAVQMVSGLVILIPLYRYMGRLGLIDTHTGVVAIYVAIGLPISVWLLKNAFDGVPMVLEEAAAIDGYNRFETFLKVTLPLAAPGIASALIINMILNWSQFLVPFIMLTADSKWPISVAIYNYAGSTTASTTQLLAAACLVTIVPAIVAFLLLQRAIVSALTAGAVKG
ncbi:carbohydrate ABC transporter permease [Pelagibacterium montanilacus]|uniref:carbohydrate ABC transporter permease n=1 Tax=Pelagibacterium montanilacus TaxID=2185280 RepID=UPI000F8F117F|nr:carbohydrate ABC transporter permease [Pelagibacterium montanilacus]